MNLTNLTREQLTLAANTIRVLSAEAVERANSGHPGMPMGAADYGIVLFLKYLRFHPQDPNWLNRDRFVLSNGHGSMFLYSMLHLMGYAVTLDDIKQFRQWESTTPGHPESHLTPGVECTTGPLGQGISNAVGMAIGQKILASRYNTPGNDIIDHRVFCFCGDGCLMEGVSSETSSLAGHLGLGNLIVIFDDNHISIAGHTELAFTEDVVKRYQAYGWHAERVDGHNFEEVDAALERAVRETDRPSLIAARTIIGKGSPNKADTHEVHGAALGKEELALTKQALNWPGKQEFYIPEEVSKLCAARVTELKDAYDGWVKQFEQWGKKFPDKAEALNAQLRLSVPADLERKLIDSVSKLTGAQSTRKLSSEVIQVASKEVPALVGGSADLEPSTLTLIKGSTDIQRESFSGKNLRFGVREHGMGAIMNGLSYYGGFIPYGSTFLCFTDYMRPTLRLAALSHLPGLFIYTHDSVFLGEDGPTHQPIEHLGSLRLIPNLYVMRPADGLETAVCYTLALTRRDGPCVLVFTRQNLNPIERAADFDPDQLRKGAYTVFQSKPEKPELVMIATGSEVPLAIASARALPSNICVRVVSMPCFEIFKQQSVPYQKAVIPDGAKLVVIEAAATLPWPGMLGANIDNLLLIGIDHFGASAPAQVIAEKLGFTPAAVTTRIVQRFFAKA